MRSDVVDGLRFAVTAITIGAVAGIILASCTGCASPSGNMAAQLLVPGYSTGKAIHQGRVIATRQRAVQLQAQAGNGGAGMMVGVDMASVLDGIKQEGFGLTWPMIWDVAKAGALYMAYDASGLNGDNDEDREPPTPDFVDGRVSASGAGSSVEIQRIYSLQQLKGIDLQASDGGTIKITHSGGE